MVRYRTRTGVILTSICGEYMLVSAKSLQNECPYVTQINETSAFLWQLLMKGATAEELETAVVKEYEVADPALVRRAIRDFLGQMTKMKYLLTDEQGGSHEE